MPPLYGASAWKRVWRGIFGLEPERSELSWFQHKIEIIAHAVEAQYAMLLYATALPSVSPQAAWDMLTGWSVPQQVTANGFHCRVTYGFTDPTGAHDYDFSRVQITIEGPADAVEAALSPLQDCFGSDCQAPVVLPGNKGQWGSTAQQATLIVMVASEQSHEFRQLAEKIAQQR
jgi:hypothetical protein